MSLCTLCPAPGACCQNMAVSGGNSRDGYMNAAGMTRAHAADVARDLGLPFVPSVEGRDTAGAPVWRYNCTALKPNGRCGMYEARPALCREYEAGSDPLCVFGRKLLEAPR